jgi:hypothetical protein
MGDIEPIQLRTLLRRDSGSSGSGGLVAGPNPPSYQSQNAVTAFTRVELSAILAVYGRLMAEGECRDYTMDFGRDTAVFSIFRRTSEVPLYRIEKTPKLARKQGAFSVVAPTGLILKRGHDLARVLEVLVSKFRVVAY